MLLMGKYCTTKIETGVDNEAAYFNLMLHFESFMFNSEFMLKYKKRHTIIYFLLFSYLNFIIRNKQFAIIKINKIMLRAVKVWC